MGNDEVREACGLSVFQEAAEQYDKLYVSILGELCQPCQELKQLVRDADIPYPIVEVPSGICPEIAGYYGAVATPTVVLLSRGNVIAKHNGPPEAIVERMKRGE